MMRFAVPSPQPIIAERSLRLDVNRTLSFHIARRDLPQSWNWDPQFGRQRCPGCVLFSCHLVHLAGSGDSVSG
jgi:hypothetical protein